MYETLIKQLKEKLIDIKKENEFTKILKYFYTYLFNYS